jgi:hypothetical protein
MRTTSKFGLAVALGLLAGSAVGAPDSPQVPPDANLERGKELVRAMSDGLAGATAFTFSTDETHVRLRKGVREERSFSRRVAVRRPDASFMPKATSNKSGFSTRTSATRVMPHLESMPPFERFVTATLLPKRFSRARATSDG